MTIPIPALEAFKRHLEDSANGEAALAIAKLDQEMSLAPDMPGSLIDAIMDVRNALARHTEKAR